MGKCPPPTEINHWPELDGPPAGKGRTRTSLTPDAVDAYAIQRPSGENAGSSSSWRVRRKSSAVPALGRSGSLVSRGNVQRSKPVSAFRSAKAKRLPSGDNE